MKKIWIINHHASFYNGRHFFIGGYLADKGYDVKVIRANTRHLTGEAARVFDNLYQEEKINGISYIFIKARAYGKSSVKRLLNMMDFTRNSIRVMKGGVFEKPDIILASSVHPLAWLAGKRLAKKFRVPLVLETRDLWPETFVSMGSMKRNSLPAKLMYAFEKHYYSTADALVFTMEGRNRYLQNIGLPREAYHVNNGVDLTTFEYNKKNFRYENKAFEEKEQFRVVYTGSIGKANRVGELVKAAEIIQKSGNGRVQFYFFGAGKELEDLQKYSTQNHLNQVHFMGLVENKYIPGILAQSDLNIISGHSIPLYAYGLSLNKLFDYLASGKPTLSNLICEYDILEKYGAGITLKCSSPETLAEKILEFEKMEPIEYAEYCRNAEIAAKDYDYKVLAEKYEELLMDTLKKKERKNEAHEYD